jgi:hypothetical protein
MKLMSRLRHVDILVEMSDLCHELMTEISQQLAYYRASVYKDEAAGVIQKKVEQLRLVTSLFGDEMLMEPVRDYEAMAKTGAMNYIPGECSLSKRVGALTTSLEAQLSRLSQELSSRGTALQLNDKDFARGLQKHRQQLLALCRYGSRQWAFFQAL